MAVKKKVEVKLDVKEIEKANAEAAEEFEAKRKAEKLARDDALAHTDKKSVKKRIEQILENPLVEVEVLDPNLPIEKEPTSAVAIEGLMDYMVHGTHLRLLAMANPHETPTLDQRVAMAKRLNEVGPYLPRYIKHVSLKDGRGLSAEEVEESKADAKYREELKASKQRASESPAEEPKERSGKGAPKPKAASITNGVPLKKICAEVDIDPKDARRALRSAKIEKPGGRWEWPAEKVDEVKKVLVEAKAELAKEGA